MRIAKLRGHYDVVAVNDLASPKQLAYAFNTTARTDLSGEVSVKSEVMEITEIRLGC